VVQLAVIPGISRPTAAQRPTASSCGPRPALLRRTVLAVGILAAFGAGAAWRGLVRPDPERIWREAEASIQAGRPVQALSGLRRLESLRSAAPQDWLLRAQVLSALGRDNESLAALHHVQDDHPLAAQAWFMAGRLERQNHRLGRAEAAFRRAIELNPGLVKARKELVYLFGMQLRRREVDAEFRALSRLTALSHHDLFTWGLTHFTVWGPDIADDLESFIRADPGDRYSRLALATLLVDAPEMESRVERTLEPLSHTDLEATALRIELRPNHGRIEEAMAMLKDAPAGHPELARLRGRVALMRGDHPAAIHHFQEALSNEPYDRVSLADLGKALLLSGDKTRAQAYLARARRLDDVYNLINQVRKPSEENQAPDLTLLGRTCEAAGLLDEARGWYLLAIGRDPLDAESQQALRRLGEAGIQREPQSSRSIRAR
jgi:tetratricopeptide (TPR) repeat protein